MSYQDSIETEIKCPNCEDNLTKIGPCYVCKTCGYKECGR